MDFGGPGLGNRAFFVVKTNAFGQPPYALPGAEALSKICQKPEENRSFHYDLLLLKFKINSTLCHLLHNFVEK